MKSGLYRMEQQNVSRPRKGAWIEIKTRNLGKSECKSPPQGGVD